MPRGDKTGPMGMGPMTGRGVGYCAGDPPLAGRAFGRGYGYGRGFFGPCGYGYGRGFGGGGRGWQNMYFAGRRSQWARFGWSGEEGSSMAPIKETEKQFLQGQAKSLQLELDEIKKRLDELTGREATRA